MAPWKRGSLTALVLAAAVVVAVMAFGIRQGEGEVPPGPRPSVPLGGDLVAFWAGGALLQADGGGGTPYDRPAALALLARLFPESPPRYRLAYPPPIYQVFALGQFLTYPRAASLLVLGMAALYSLGVAALLAGFPSLRGRRAVAWALLWASPAAVMMSLTGQLSGAWVLIVGGAAWAWSRGRGVLAGLLLGLLWLKPTLAVPVGLGLVITGQGRALLGFVAGGALVLGVSLAAGGGELWQGYLEMVRGTPDLTQRMWVYPERQFTLRTLLSLPARHSGLAVPLGWGGIALGVTLCAALAPVTWRAARRPATAMLARGAALSAALLAAPHLFDYDLGLHGIGLVASACLLAEGRARWPRIGWSLTGAAYLAPLAYPSAALLRLNVGTLALVAWVVWMAFELRAITRRSAAGTA